MGSLRTLHLFLILVSIVLADVFGAWAIAEQTHDLALLIRGWVGFAVSFALIGYGLWVVRKFDRARIE